MTAEKGCVWNDSNIQSQYFTKENKINKNIDIISKWLEVVEVATQCTPIIIDNVNKINRGQTSPIFEQHKTDNIVLVPVENIVVEEILLGGEEVTGNVLRSEVCSEYNDVEPCVDNINEIAIKVKVQKTHWKFIFNGSSNI